LFSTFILSAFSNSGSNPQSNSQASKNEIIINNDLENAIAKNPSWKGEIVVFNKKEKAHSGDFIYVTNDTLENNYTYNEIFKNTNKSIPKSVVFTGWVYNTVGNPKF
jgi:hypothetical protein